jgi:hypothetical protein
MTHKINGSLKISFKKISARIILLAMACCLPVSMQALGTRTPYRSPFLAQIGEQAAEQLKQPHAFAQMARKQQEAQDMRSIVARMADRGLAEKKERESKNTTLGVNKNVATVMSAGIALLELCLIKHFSDEPAQSSAETQTLPEVRVVRPISREAQSMLFGGDPLRMGLILTELRNVRPAIFRGRWSRANLPDVTQGELWRNDCNK